MKILKKYFKIVHEIYDYFDYSSGKKIYPIEDYTDYRWQINNNTLHYWVDADDDPIIEDYIEQYDGDDYKMFLIKDSLNFDDCLIIFNKEKQIKE